MQQLKRTKTTYPRQEQSILLPNITYSIQSVLYNHHHKTRKISNVREQKSLKPQKLSSSAKNPKTSEVKQTQFSQFFSVVNSLKGSGKRFYYRCDLLSQDLFLVFSSPLFLVHLLRSQLSILHRIHSSCSAVTTVCAVCHVRTCNSRERKGENQQRKKS